MWTRVCFPGLGPKDSTECAIFDGFMGLDEFGCVYEVLKITMEYTRCFHGFQHAFRLCCISAEGFGGDYGFLMFTALQNRQFMQVIWQRNTDNIHIRMCDGCFHLGGPVRTLIVVRKLLRTFFPAGIDRHDLIPTSQTLDGICIKTADKA